MLRCEVANGTFGCTSTDGQERAAIQALQQLIRDTAGKLKPVRADLPPALLTAPVDGRIGASTAIGVQFLLMTLRPWAPLPNDLQGLLAPHADVQGVIQRVAEQTRAIGSYIANVVSVLPQALTSPPPRAPRAPVAGSATPPPSGTAKIKQTAKTILGVGLGLAALGGGVVVAKRQFAKRQGLVDQAHLLPGGDEDD